MKKLLSFILAIVLCFSLCACSGNKENLVDSSQSTTAASGNAEVLSFKGEDIYGNKVSSDIFKDSKITVINVWGTFCSPCIYEMPFLGELSREYDKKDVQFVGLVIDVVDYFGNIDEATLSTARDIAEETKADYIHLIPAGDLTDFAARFTSVPTTLFVNSKGEFIGGSFVGSKNKDNWKTIIDDVLNGVS